MQINLMVSGTHVLGNGRRQFFKHSYPYLLAGRILTSRPMQEDCKKWECKKRGYPDLQSKFAVAVVRPTPRAFENLMWMGAIPSSSYLIVHLSYHEWLELRDLVENWGAYSANVDQTCRVRDLHVCMMCTTHGCVVSYCLFIQPLS